MSYFWTDFSHNPWFELGRSLSSYERLRREMDRLFDDYGQAVGGRVEGATGPLAELHDTGSEYVARVDVPGLTEKDLDISVTGNTVTLRGLRKDAAPEGYLAHRRERGAIEFARSWRLPARVEGERTQATLKDGVLLLTVPKAKEAQPKQITVKAS